MRYVILVLLNTPIILLALINILTQYKLRHITANRFRLQIILWLSILVALTSSFPLYNYITGRPLLDSAGFSSFDITQTTVLIYMIYAVNNQRRKIEQNERLIRDLHQELSIKLSETNGKS